MKQPRGVPGARQQTKVTLKDIPEGRAGVRATLKIMAEMIRAARHDHRIREKTLRLIRHLPQKDWVGEIEAVFRYVQRRIRYVNDPLGMETVAEPWKTIELGQGDCDDKVVLAAAMLQSIGHPVRLVAVGFDGGPISHVYLETQVAVQWVPLELTDCSMELGEPPEGVTDVMVQYIKLR